VASSTSASQGSGGEPTVHDLLEQARQHETDDIPRARALVQQARVLSHAAGDSASEAEALYRLAELSYASGATNEAFAVALESRDLAHTCAATITEVSALNLIAAVQYHAANFSEALVSAVAALETYRSTGERSSEGLLLNSLAVIQHGLRDTDKAIVTYEAAYMANRDEHRPDLDAITLANMAKVRADRKEYGLAVSLGEDALALSKAHAAEFVPEILARLSIAYVALAALDRAAAALDEADGVLRDRTARRVALSPGSVVTVRIARGELYVAQHLRDQALREWADALELATQANMTEVSLGLREKLANLNKEMGRFEEALAHQEARYALNEDISNRAADLRIQTLSIQHETESSRLQAEVLRLRTTEVEQVVQARIDAVESFLIESFQHVALLTESSTDDTAEHLRRVGVLAGEIAEDLGEDVNLVRRLPMAARLHDVGKVGLPDSVLNNAGPLSPEEVEQMKTHTTLGHDILSGSSSPLFQLAAEVAYTHHERWDGTGYPRGLAGELIPTSGRITAVADVYDALVSTRVYKESWSKADALAYVVAGSGRRFDPRIVGAFIRVMARRDPALVSSLDRSLPG